MGYLWHGHYLAYFEQARTDWFRARGGTYRALEDAGTLLVVVETGVKFRKPAGYDDEVVVVSRLVSAEGVRLRFEYEVRRGRDLLATGFTVLACADKNGRPVRPPEDLLTLVGSAPQVPAAPSAGTPGTAAAVQGGRS
jgi:acyl-CoA thioester hydrolase